MDVIDLCERGLVPDALARLGMRRLMAARLKKESADRSEQESENFAFMLDALRNSPIAESTDKANEQHYEVPAAFFLDSLGAHLKYSCCYWDNTTRNLDEAEARMLALSCERAELTDGQRILELGCGWGSLTLWMAEHYPASDITAVSNSVSQREFIMARAAERGLTNVMVITADANEFKADGLFDRVMSVEMFEHMKNYQLLMDRIADWLKPGGKLFVHIFVHRTLMYPFTTEGEYDWMGRYFFTGGLMPAESTLLYFQQHLQIESQWRVSGTHYEKTSNAWLARMDANEAAISKLFVNVYGADEATRWVNRWRMFYMAVAELFGYSNGTEWMVAHYLFVKPD